MQDTWIDFCKARDRDQKSYQLDWDEQIEWFDYVKQHYTDPLPVAGESRNWMDTE